MDITHKAGEPLTHDNFFGAVKERHPDAYRAFAEWLYEYFGKEKVDFTAIKFAMQVGVLYDFFCEKSSMPEFIVYDNWKKPHEVVDNLVLYFAELEEQINNSK